jgi:hypothetical protein
MKSIIKETSDDYLQLFEYITKHGTYIDGFAAPQDAEHLDLWSAKLVLEMVPKWFRDFWLCDISRAGIEKLRTLEAEHASSKRRVTVLEGDFNEKVYEVLNSGRIKEKTATFHRITWWSISATHRKPPEVRICRLSIQS